MLYYLFRCTFTAFYLRIFIELEDQPHITPNSALLFRFLLALYQFWSQLECQASMELFQQESDVGFNVLLMEHAMPRAVVLTNNTRLPFCLSSTILLLLKKMLEPVCGYIQ